MKYDIFTTNAIKWQKTYCIDWLPWKVIEVKKYNWYLDYEIFWNVIFLKEAPKRKFTLKVTILIN